MPKSISKELAYYGIGFEGGEFKPNEKITQKDFLALLMSINGNDIIVLKKQFGTGKLGVQKFSTKQYYFRR